MFEDIYREFSGLFGSNLAEHLRGWDEAAGDYAKTNLFSIVGIIALATALVACVTYYYILNHPRQNRWQKWMFFWLLPVAVVNFFVAFGITYKDVLADNISSDIAQVSWLKCLGFGFVNFIVSAIFFTLISFVIHWGSRNCKYSPFIKF
ncbi:MAG: hypothetical protein LBN23_02215 [Paludibacter sp.]|jgi:hypothetical protein|nr:hypothetical protein [Paludibacter sp.]